jgi:predicted AlkP superfamily pyrophosphatase or phosphodiesterase
MTRFFAFFLVAIGMGMPVLASPPDRPVTILISIDGFRPDYLDRGITPRLSRAKAEGVFARMRPSFPTKTFPNHYTLVTGLRPDRHGIVANNMIDPARPGQMFSLSDPKQSLDPFWWEGAEPVWTTAEKQGIRTATAFWPGSEVINHGVRPQDWLRFDQNVTNVQRVNTVLDWMRRPTAIRPVLVTLYFDTVDTKGHRFGTDSVEVNAAISEVDTRIGELADGLAAMGIAANIVIVSDHGMAAQDEKRTIQLETLIDKASYVAVETGPYAAIEPVTGTDNRVPDALLKPHEHMTCQRKEDLPKRLHYGSNARVAAILCLAEPGWSILSGTPMYPLSGANHGWDNQAPDMNALFLGFGPAFARAKELPIFDNVDIYALVTSLAGVKPLANDGSAHLVTETSAEH